MQAALLYGARDVRVEEVEAPEPGPAQVLVDVAACGICGSDLHVYEHPSTSPGRELPRILGHEIGGTVVEVGADVVGVDPGTDVVLSPHEPCGECWCCEAGEYNLCRDLTAGTATPGGYTERVVTNASNAIPVPPGVSPENAAIAQPVSVGLHAVRQSPLDAGDSVAVFGTGPIGLGALHFARSGGAGPIYASEPRDSRRAVAAAFGADVVVDPTEEDPVERIREEHGGGVDVAFEAVGHETTFDQAVRSTRAGGHTTVIGVFDDDVAFQPGALVRHQRTVGGSTSHLIGPRVTAEYDVVLRQLASGDLDADQYVTSRIGLDDAVEDGFEALLDAERAERKILVCP